MKILHELNWFKTHLSLASRSNNNGKFCGKSRRCCYDIIITNITLCHFAFATATHFTSSFEDVQKSPCHARRASLIYTNFTGMVIILWVELTGRDHCRVNRNVQAEHVILAMSRPPSLRTLIYIKAGGWQCGLWGQHEWELGRTQIQSRQAIHWGIIQLHIRIFFSGSLMPEPVSPDRCANAQFWWGIFSCTISVAVVDLKIYN